LIIAWPDAQLLPGPAPTFHHYLPDGCRTAARHPVPSPTPPPRAKEAAQVKNEEVQKMRDMQVQTCSHNTSEQA